MKIFSRVNFSRILRQTSLVFLAFMAIVLANVAFLGITVASDAGLGDELSIEQVSAALKRESSGTYSLAPSMKKQISEGHNWTMLLDENGTVVWSYKLPADLPRSYSIADVAAMSRWYVNDYPVEVWSSHNGLLVLGHPKDSLWKFSVVQKISGMWVFPVAIVLNTFLIFLVTYVLVRFNARERSKARTEWIATVSHDVRTPLQLALTYSDEIAHDDDNTEETRRKAEHIVSNTQHVAELISDLNTANRLAYSLQPLHTATERIAPIVRATIAQILNEGLDERFEIDLFTSEAAQTATGIVDKTLLARGLTNLIRNSIKHNPRGCSVTVHCDVSARKIPWGKDSFEIAIRDTGSGYPPELVQELQTIDSRYSTETLKTLPEHGLGLVIVSRIVRAHGGEVTFRNTAQGSETVIVIPCRRIH